MAKHYCNKEKEISEIHQMVAGMNVTVTALNKAIMGNGQVGLLEKFNQYEGARKLVVWLFSSSFIVSLCALVAAIIA